MKIYKTQQEVEADIVDGVLTIQGDVSFEFSLSIEASIIVNAWDINARNIIARDINARNIIARDINAGDIIAEDIKAGNISFFAVAFARVSFKCKSIIGKRENNKYFCLDSEVEIVNNPPKEII